MKPEVRSTCKRLQGLHRCDLRCRRRGPPCCGPAGEARNVLEDRRGGHRVPDVGGTAGTYPFKGDLMRIDRVFFGLLRACRLRSSRRTKDGNGDLPVSASGNWPAAFTGSAADDCRPCRSTRASRARHPIARCFARETSKKDRPKAAFPRQNSPVSDGFGVRPAGAGDSPAAPRPASSRRPAAGSGTAAGISATSAIRVSVTPTGLATPSKKLM